jgi:hypothetical protein
MVSTLGKSDGEERGSRGVVKGRRKEKEME